MPKVKRIVPLFTSVPTTPHSSPKTVIATPLSGEPRAIVAPASRPSSMIEKISVGPNLKAIAHQQRRQEDHHDDADRRGEERRDHRDAQRRAAFALLRHRVAVEAGDRVRRMDWQVQQDGADRAAILRAVEDAREHQDRRHRCDRCRSAAAASRSPTARPCPAARRSGCRPARRRTTTSDCRGCSATPKPYQRSIRTVVHAELQSAPGEQRQRQLKRPPEDETLATTMHAARAASALRNVFARSPSAEMNTDGESGRHQAAVKAEHDEGADTAEDASPAAPLPGHRYLAYPQMVA